MLNSGSSRRSKKPGQQQQSITNFLSSAFKSVSASASTATAPPTYHVSGPRTSLTPGTRPIAAVKPVVQQQHAEPRATPSSVIDLTVTSPVLNCVSIGAAQRGNGRYVELQILCIFYRYSQTDEMTKHYFLTAAVMK